MTTEPFFLKNFVSSSNDYYYGDYVDCLIDVTVQSTNYQNTLSKTEVSEQYQSSPVDELAHIFMNAFDNSLDEADRTASIILTLQQFVLNRNYQILNNILSHHQATKLHPSIMLGILFITENLEPLRESWENLDSEFRKTI